MLGQAVRKAWTSFAGGMYWSLGDPPARDNQFFWGEDVRVNRHGQMTGRYGIPRCRARPASSQCWMLVAFESGSTLYWVGVWGTTCYVSSNQGSSWTSLGSVSATAGWYTHTLFTSGGTTRLYFCNGNDNLYYTDGSSLSSYASPTIPIAGPTWVAAFNDRLWIAKDTTSTVYACKISTPGTWDTPDGLSIPINTQDGEAIRGLAPAGPHLLVFKKNSISTVDGYGNSTVIVTSGTRAVAVAGSHNIYPRTVAQTPIGTVWTTLSGVYAYSNGTITPIGAGIRGYLRDTGSQLALTRTANRNHGRVPCAAYLPETNEYCVAIPVDMPADGSDGYASDKLFRINLDNDRTLIDRVSAVDGDGQFVDGIDISAMCATNAGTTEDHAASFLISACSDGWPRMHDMPEAYRDAMTNTAGTLSDGYRIIPFVYTAPDTLGAPAVRKRIRRVGISTAADGKSGDIQVLPLADMAVYARTEAGWGLIGEFPALQTLSFSSSSNYGRRWAMFSQRAEETVAIYFTFTITDSFFPIIIGAAVEAELMPASRR